MLAAAAVAAALAAGSCSGSEQVTTPSSTTATTEASVPSFESSTSSTEVTVPVTDPPTTQSTSTTSTTSPPTTTTEPFAVQELVLGVDGLGSALFGADAQFVIDYVTSILGGNTEDTGWVDPFTFGACDGTVARRVKWGDLSLIFGDLSPFANGRRHFLGYEYGTISEIGGEPVGLRTPGGVTLGSRVVDLLAEFPEAAVNPEQPDIGSPPNFYVSDDFRGLLTGTDPEDVVMVVFGGYGCGE